MPMLLTAVWTLSLALILMAHFYLDSVVAEDFFCSEDNTDVRIQGEVTGRIITLHQGEAVYRNNMQCSWTLESDPDKRIQMRVELSNLQWSPPESICDGYDHVDVKDEETLLASWCGEEFPRVINSKGNKVKIIFKTDASNPPSYSYQGVRLVFEVFNKSSCPPDWKIYRDFCYSKGHKESSWSSSQSWCNYGQANLLSLSSDEEFAFITQAFLNNSQEDYYWTGLNDFSVSGSLKWIDSTAQRRIMGMPLPLPAEFYHCGAFRAADQRLMMKDCDRAKFQYLCKANRTGVTVLYILPTATTDKGDPDESSHTKNILLGVFIPAVVILLVVLCIFSKVHCCRRTSKENITNISDARPAAPPSYEEALRGSDI